jgi:hypothetical protein
MLLPEDNDLKSNGNEDSEDLDQEKDFK